METNQDILSLPGVIRDQTGLLDSLIHSRGTYGLGKNPIRPKDNGMTMGGLNIGKISNVLTNPGIR